MAVPKKKSSRSRRNKRRYSNTYRLKAAGTAACTQCNSPRIPHRVCDNCGYYDGKMVISPKVEAA